MALRWHWRTGHTAGVLQGRYCCQSVPQPPPTWDGVIVPQLLQVSAIARAPRIRRKYPVEGRVLQQGGCCTFGNTPWHWRRHWRRGSPSDPLRGGARRLIRDVPGHLTLRPKRARRSRTTMPLCPAQALRGAKSMQSRPLWSSEMLVDCSPWRLTRSGSEAAQGAGIGAWSAAREW